MSDKKITILGKEIILREYITIPELHKMFPEAIVCHTGVMYSLKEGYSIDKTKFIRTLNIPREDLPMLTQYSSLGGVGVTFKWLGIGSENIQSTRLFIGQNYSNSEPPSVWDEINPYQIWEGLVGDENTMTWFLSVKDNNEDTICSSLNTVKMYKVKGELGNIIPIPLISEP